MSNLYDELEQRGLINQITNEEIKNELAKPISLYCGFDPTADSLHIGHLLPLCILKRFIDHNHKGIALIGGATGLIGDPSFKKDERALQTKEQVIKNVEGISKQIKKIINNDNLVMHNNYEWVKEINTIDFLRDYGKHFTINYMMNKECVSSRVETGLSFTEFSYMILQSLDFLELYKRENCTLQIGGSDQWGNITSGIELIRRNGIKEQMYGLTIPLVTKSDGTKFGKTESGAIWLDETKTSPYEFYQYFYNVEDKDVIKYLKYFTFISLDEIKGLEKELNEKPFLRSAQKKLAEEITKFVHGEDALIEVKKITECLFSGDISSLSLEEIEKYFNNIKQYQTDKRLLIDALIDVELASSRREAREFISNNSIKINGKVIDDIDYEIKNEDLIGNKYMMIKRGKKKIHFVRGLYE